MWCFRLNDFKLEGDNLFLQDNGMIRKFIASPIDRILNKKSRNAIENGAVAEAIERIESDIERLEGLKASLTQAGNVRLSSATNVTDSTGLALPVTEKNASVEGTIANQVHNIENSISVKRNMALLFSTYATVVGGILTTTSAPAPTNSYNVNIASIDLYGERMLTEDERSKFNILIRSGGFILTSTDETIKNLTGNRILILGYSFI